jgi:hypothetical protein
MLHIWFWFHGPRFTDVGPPGWLTVVPVGGRHSGTAGVYEIIVERHPATATIPTSDREPPEWLALMADSLLAQSAIDRLQSAAWELVLDSESLCSTTLTRLNASAAACRRFPDGRRAQCGLCLTQSREAPGPCQERRP